MAAPLRRRADIEGLRAIAVLLVVAFHGGLPPGGGFVGVDLFFVISGFVITGTFLPALEREGSLRLRSFYARRVRRLFPALALTIVVTLALSSMLLSPLGPQQATASTGAAASLISANVQLYRARGGGYFDAPSESNALLHLWSLSVEEQFYLFLPAFLLVAWRVTGRGRSGSRSRRGTAALVGAIAIGSFALSLATSFGHGFAKPEQFAFYSSPTRVWELATGVLLALGVPVLRRLPSRAAQALAAGGCVLIAASAFAISASTAFPGVAALLPVGGAALVVAGGTASTTGVTRWLGARPLVWIGGLSYAWYLWHWPVIVFAKALWPAGTVPTAVAAGVSLAPAWLSWRFVETPLRFHPRLTGRRVVALAVVCVVVPLAAAGGVRAVGSRERSASAYAQLVDETARHRDNLDRCDTGAPLASRAAGACTWSIAGARGTIYLVGDSNAGQFTEPVIAAGNRDGYDVVVVTRSACPFVDLEVSGPFVPGDCRPFVLDTLGELVRRAPSLVVIAGDATNYVEPDTTALRDPTTGERSTAAADKARLWGAGVDRVLRPLDDAGIPTLLVHTVPQFGAIQVDSCPPFRVLRDVATCGASRARTEVEAEQRPTREVEERAVARRRQAHGLDLTDQLCDATSCSMYRDGHWRYRDGGHLSVGGASDLADTFAAAIAVAARR